SIDNGITLDGATNNSLEYNNMIWNNYGVDIMNGASYNTITENNISSNIVCGVIMKSGTENNISRNIISNNFIGLRLRNIPRNYFTYNLISNNSNIGIQVIGDTHDLEIHHNDIINNTIQAVDDGTNNRWDNGIEGNYWSDWTSPDTSIPIGIVDNPRPIDGTNDSEDRYPLTNTTVWIGWGPVYNIDKKTYHKTISEGVGAASDYDRLWVSSGIYFENVWVIKPLRLIGQDRERTRIDAQGQDAIKIQANDVNMRGFTLFNGSNLNSAGIRILSASNCRIEDVGCINNYYGFSLESSNGNTITNNSISSNTNHGMSLLSSSGNYILTNVINSNEKGIECTGSSSDNRIINNNISDNNNYCIDFGSSTSGNLVYHNNFFNNLAFDASNDNIWNVSYPTGGNYWSVYIGWDNFSGPGQNITGCDGFGDTNYSVDSDTTDHYPLMVPKPYYPYKPQNLMATPGDCCVHLTWDPPGYDGGLPVTNYNIYRGTTSGEEKLLATIGNILWFNDTTVLGGEIHYYIRAVNDMGEGDISDKVSATSTYISPVFLGNARHTGLSLYDTSDIDGVLKWSYDASSSIYSSPAIGIDGTLYFGTYSGDLIAINPDGTEKWSYATGGPIYSSPAITSNGTILIGSNDNRLHTVNPDGSPKWTYMASDNIYSSPVIGYDGTIYFGSYDGTLYALNPDGNLKWSTLLSDKMTSSAALGVDDTIYIGSGVSLYSITPEGSIKWSFVTGDIILSSPAIDINDNIYFGSTDTKLYALDADGNQKWSYTTGDEIHSSPAIGGDGTIYFRSTDGILYAFDSEGIPKWQQVCSPGSWVDSSPTISSDETIYMGSHENSFYALYQNGTLKWDFPIVGRTFTPAIGNSGMVYVASESGILYAIGGSIIPEAPEGLQAAAGDNYVELTWDVPSYDGGSSITNYRIYRGNISGGETFLAEIGDVLTYLDTNVRNGDIYYYIVRAVNKRGEGPDSSEATAKPATVPDGPTLMVESDGDSFVNLSWNPPAFDGGDPIANYRIYRGSSSGGQTFLLELENVSYYQDTDVTNGGSYYYIISAVNAVGEGNFSNEVNATPSTVSESPTDLITEVGDSYVLLTWSAPVYDGGSVITGYAIYREDVSGIYSTLPSNQISFNDTDLENGITYTYHIRAINGRGEGSSL
ncbi:MAG: PQQ-binding-like beta-propeller repeat protein, partial [Thermoplasmata archaeon]